MQDRGFYTGEQAADTLDLTPGRIRQMLRGGDLEGSKEPRDRGWRITRESVEEVRRRRPPPRERCGQMAAIDALDTGVAADRTPTASPSRRTAWRSPRSETTPEGSTRGSTQAGS